MQGKAVPGLYTAPYQYTCMSAYARARIGSTVTGDPCPEPTAFANGSALVYFNSTSYYDDMLWAASWLYLATGAPCPAEHCLPGTWISRMAWLGHHLS